MDDRLRETLSAMMDDQADELSVRRLLSHADQEQVRGQWQRWQTLRDVMRDDEPALHFGLDVSAGVREALDEDRNKAAPVPVKASRWKIPGAAVAMISTALLLGYGAGSNWSPATSSDATSLAQSSLPAPENADIASDVSGSDVPEVSLQRLDDRQREYLSRYLLEHAQNSSVAAGRGSFGFARVASVAGQ